MISVVDIFAGPGGLGEGFSSFVDKRGRSPYKLAVSLEKDGFAFETLRLRAFRRQFEASPHAYVKFISGNLDWPGVRDAHPKEVAKAEAEVVQFELGPAQAVAAKTIIDARLGRAEKWILIGGPPCQAYSLVGRVRNRGNAEYVPEQDHRQTLYLEYLQILADHAPPVFVMENVKGLLSAQLNRSRLFDLIRSDLSDPATALRREGRVSRHRSVKYRIHALVPPSSLWSDDPSDFVVRSEFFGIPQRRHRVILIGIRDDISGDLKPLLPSRPQTTKQALAGLPKLRSGLSRATDSSDAWVATLKGMRRERWLDELAPEVRRTVRDAIAAVKAPQKQRGADYLPINSGEVLNHATRSHIVPDLRRYLFSAAYCEARGESPRMADFPTSLLPDHKNVRRAVDDGLFADRFRVQLPDQPSTTITSHISKDGHYYIHYDATQCRSFTVREAARLQTFPDEYFFCGPRTSQYQQVGNAVPPQLAKQIAALLQGIID